MVQYRDPGAIIFEATIEKPEGPGAYVEFPLSVFDESVRLRGIVGAARRKIPSRGA